MERALPSVRLDEDAGRGAQARSESSNYFRRGALGLRVWVDEFELQIGDSLRRKIDAGLARSRFGVVVLSHAFFSKNWPQYELDGLVTREMTGEQVILPLWHQISKAEVIIRSPSLADKLARSTSELTVQEIAKEIAGLVRDEMSPA